MTVSRQIGRQAPYLRRYARALTGSQTAGDGAVEAAMEGLLSGAIQLDETLGVRPSLYAALHRARARMRRDEIDGEARPEADAADLHLQSLGEAPRAALLLVGMEGFAVSEAATILGVDDSEISGWLQTAEAAIRRQLAAKILIIEDEPIIGLDLTRLARELGHDVVGVAATRDEAVALAQSTSPGLILADVRLADGSSGMDAAADILKSFDIPVIFITAFPEHLLTGDRPEPAFLITKPFREDAVKALISQALFFRQRAIDGV